jgi:hypothetical protein
MVAAAVLEHYDLLEAARRDQLVRKRAEMTIRRRMDEAVRTGNIDMLRGNRIALAALRFAYEGSAEQHGALALLDNEGRCNLDSVGQAIGGQQFIGVEHPTLSDVRSFVHDVSAFVVGLQMGNLEDCA